MPVPSNKNVDVPHSIHNHVNKGISSRAYNGGVRGKGGKSIVKKYS